MHAKQDKRVLVHFVVFILAHSFYLRRIRQALERWELLLLLGWGGLV